MGTNRHAIGTHPSRTRDVFGLRLQAEGRVGGPSLMGGGALGDLSEAGMGERGVSR
jgi:hypothetical protein